MGDDWEDEAGWMMVSHAALSYLAVRARDIDLNLTRILGCQWLLALSYTSPWTFAVQIVTARR